MEKNKELMLVFTIWPEILWVEKENILQIP